MWFTIFDSRIKASVAGSCMNTFREKSLELSCCGIQFLPGLLQYADVPDLFCLIPPRPLQLQAGTDDRGTTPRDRDMIEKEVRSAYRRRRAEDAFSYILHNEGHGLLWDAAKDFIAKHL